MWSSCGEAKRKRKWRARVRASQTAFLLATIACCPKEERECPEAPERIRYQLEGLDSDYLYSNSCESIDIAPGDVLEFDVVDAIYPPGPGDARCFQACPNFVVMPAEDSVDGWMNVRAVEPENARVFYGAFEATVDGCRATVRYWMVPFELEEGKMSSFYRQIVWHETCERNWCRDSFDATRLPVDE